MLHKKKIFEKPKKNLTFDKYDHQCFHLIDFKGNFWVCICMYK